MKYGLVTTEIAKARRWAPAIVLINKVDVSEDCVVADDVNGYVIIMVRDNKGELELKPDGKPVKARVRGNVEFYPRNHWEGAVRRLLATVK